jgi:predicted amidohydrolase YtcJ
MQTNKRIYRLTFIFSLFVLVIGLTASIQKKQTPAAELVLQNGKIITLDESSPEVEALAVFQDRILAIGTKKEIKPYITKSTRIIDLQGKCAIPGFIESHGHFLSLGRSKMQLDLTKIRNWDEAVKMVAEAVKRAKPGQWITGRGWHQEKWDKEPNPNVDGLPFHDSMSNVSPENPVMLTHASGHSCFINAKAMEMAGIDEKTPNPEGGEIVKDKNGKPIGVFRETAQELLQKAMSKALSQRTPGQVKTETLKMIKLAEQACLENGVTTFHDAWTSFDTIDLYKQLVEEKKLGVRLNVMIGESNQLLRQHIGDYKIIGAGNYHLTVRTIKRLIDGALGAHGAWLFEPYNSLPTSTGLNTEPIPAMKETARIAIENDFQLATHAIGDRANRETLNIYEQAFKAHPEKKDLRWRVEHAQHLHPDDIPRFRKLGVIASMQANHCTSDGPYVLKRLGEKRAKQGAYVWRKLIDSGAIICNGTDVPVEDISPIACYYAAVTRKMKNGKVFFGDQCMTREEALRAYTINGAYAAFEENIKGTLEKGKLADITVLSKDILTIPDDDILNTEVLYTIVGGKVLYQKKIRPNSNSPQMADYLPQPGELNEWEPAGTSQHVVGDDLFLLINGGAEIYHEYGFKQAIVRGFRHKKQETLQFNLEIYEMQNPEAAYGIYTFKTGDSGKAIDVGNEGLLEDYYLNFRKGNFLVTVIGFDAKEETIAGITAVAKVVAAKIKGSSQRPELVHLLPDVDLLLAKPGGITYLKGNLALVNNYRFDSRDIFALKEGVIGDYGNFKLFLFRYSETGESQKRFKAATNYLKRNPQFVCSVQPDGTLVMTHKKGISFYIESYNRYILIFQGDKEKAVGILGKIRNRL